MTLLLVVVGGAVGAACRLAVGHATIARLGAALPWGTFAVNVAGSLLLGLLAGAASGLSGWVGPLVGTGFCGALTTYSTFSYETVRLAGDRPAGYRRAVLNVTATVLVGVGAAALGSLVGRSY